MPASPRRQLLNFTLIGGLGFGVDAGVLSLLCAYFGFNVYAARLVSFLFATLATWWLNRTRTFAAAPGAGLSSRANEYARYLTVQVGGGLINLAVFAAAIYLNPSLQAIPVVPLALGSGVALFWNFFGARLWVYRCKPA